MTPVFSRARALAARGVVTLFVLAVSVDDAGAKSVRLDDETLEVAVTLAKDREQLFAGEPAMSVEDFQKAWAGFAERMTPYEGAEITLKRFGNDVRFRKGFAHIIFVALRAQTRSLELKPSAQDLVARHPFLQELVIEGSCYTGGDPFPKKLAELIQANPGIEVLLGETLARWDPKYGNQFRKLFPDLK